MMYRTTFRVLPYDREACSGIAPRSRTEEEYDMKKSLIAAAIAAASLAPVAAPAQDASAAAAPTGGAKVYGPEGNDVGTVESAQNTVNTVHNDADRDGTPATA